MIKCIDYIPTNNIQKDYKYVVNINEIIYK